MTGRMALLALVATAVLWGAAKADTVYLASGGSLSGTVVHLGGDSLVVEVPGRGNLILPWGEVKRVEFQSASEGLPLPLDEVAWNNALVEVCQRLEALSPLKTLFVDLGLTWVAFAFGNYLEDHCGRPTCYSTACVLATVGAAKTVWDVLTFPRRRAALQAELERLWQLGQANGYVFRGCYVSEHVLWADLR